ncbi:MAG: glycosyltransferase [Thermoplasmata archaeon]
MKVYFSVIGIGLGHMTRCLSIAEHLRRNGTDCVFSSYGKAVDLAEKSGFRTYRSKPIMWYQNEEGLVDFEKTLLNGPLMMKKMVGHFRREQKIVRKENPTLVVSDSRYSIIPASKDLNVPRLFITNQPKIYMPRENHTLNGTTRPWEKAGNWFNYRLLSGQNRVLLPDFPLPYSISERHMKFTEAPESFKCKTEFVGPIAPHRPNGASMDELQECCSKYGVEPGEFIYIAFSGPGKVKKEIKESIFSVFPDFDVPTIMGTAKPGKFKIHEKGNLRLVDGWIEERAGLMEASKLVISRAGLSTLSEMLAFGKKSVVIPQANQPEQESNAAGIEKLGVADRIEPCDITPERLLEGVKSMMRSREAEKAARKWKKKAEEWNGEKRCAEIIMGYMGVRNACSGVEVS